MILFLFLTEAMDVYDGEDELDENNNDDQPFDLSRGRTSSGVPGRPLDLAAHPLDLSLKSSRSTISTPPSSD